jgi:hypothetical protein
MPLNNLWKNLPPPPNRYLSSLQVKVLYMISKYQTSLLKEIFPHKIQKWIEILTVFGNMSSSETFCIMFLSLSLSSACSYETCGISGKILDGMAH